MKVIFVIQGEGRGHLTQALALKQMMEREGHEVVKMLVGKSKMRELPSFFVNQAGCPMEQFYSPNFLPAKDNRRCGLLRSIAYNISLTPTYLSSILYIRNQVRKSGAELVVNFYELLCGLAYAMFHFGIPEVCVGHQYLFLHPSFKMPQRHTLSGAMLKLFTRFTCLRATSRLALSLRNYEKNPVPGMKVVPPLLRSEVKHVVRASWLPSRALAMNIVIWVRTPMAMLRTRGWCSNALDGLFSNLQIQTPLRKHFPWTKTGNAIPLNGVAECSSFKLRSANKVVCCDG